MKVIKPKGTTILSTSVTESDAPLYNPATAYTAGQQVLVTGQHRVYQALKPTTGQNPPDNLLGTDPAWSDTGATNAYKMVDEFINTQTLGGELLDVTVDCSRCDAVALFGVEGRSLTLDHIVGGVIIFTETFQILQPVYTYSDYCFADRIFARNIFTALPLRATATLRIRIDAGTGGVAKLGNVVLGLSSELGKTQWGVELGILSSSKKNTDSFGRTSLIKGANSNTVQFTANLDSVEVDFVNSVLRDLDGIAAVYVAHNEGDYAPSSLIAYGFFNEFSIVIPGLVQSTVSFTVNCLI